MSVIWIEDEFSFDDSERTVRGDRARDTREECERCGELAAGLYEIEDNDPSVGYYSSIKVCAVCSGGRA